MARIKQKPTPTALRLEWVSNRKAMADLGVSAGFMTNLRMEGLSFAKVGRNIFYRISDINKLMEANKII